MTPKEQREIIVRTTGISLPAYDYLIAAMRVLTSEAAEAYAVGDYSALTDDDHKAIEAEVESIVRERCTD